MTKVVIRRAEGADAPSIHSLYKELVDNPEVSVSQERVATVSKDPRTVLLIAEVEGSAVGTALVSLCSDVMFQNQPFAVVENIIVTGPCRGFGVGASLMREIERYCLEGNCSKIMLLSSLERTDAHHFFEKTGFAGAVKKGFVKYRRQFEHG
ncbi:GNAT family N-acetyltransferase [Uliginosibacterium aquaticum]|uniref:GNAT family N-acetyltransferase n=1 Tax=Uliginosibacterium aquaticum TaxID=2731212 RepID=A0ABX2IJ82_9RHOO|nr:GNAT family N-acetyltransferase [Uliginosibacterium aquaticum]NSL54684.1 GNAT family N-acetyltransferase [Uliginosibacterium aquaticum]